MVLVQKGEGFRVYGLELGRAWSPGKSAPKASRSTTSSALPEPGHPAPSTLYALSSTLFALRAIPNLETLTPETRTQKAETLAWLRKATGKSAPKHSRCARCNTGNVGNAGNAESRKHTHLLGRGS